MAKRFEVKCVICGKLDRFDDDKAITYAKWKVLGWNVGTSEPICVCDKCEYTPLTKNIA